MFCCLRVYIIIPVGVSPDGTHANEVQVQPCLWRLPLVSSGRRTYNGGQQGGERGCGLDWPSPQGLGTVVNTQPFRRGTFNTL